MAAGIADQDVTAAAAIERFGAVGGDDDVVATGSVSAVTDVALLITVAVVSLLVAMPSDEV